MRAIHALHAQCLATRRKQSLVDFGSTSSSAEPASASCRSGSDGAPDPAPMHHLQATRTSRPRPTSSALSTRSGVPCPPESTLEKGVRRSLDMCEEMHWASDLVASRLAPFFCGIAQDCEGDVSATCLASIAWRCSDDTDCNRAACSCGICEAFRALLTNLWVPKQSKETAQARRSSALTGRSDVEEAWGGRPSSGRGPWTAPPGSAGAAPRIAGAWRSPPCGCRGRPGSPAERRQPPILLHHRSARLWAHHQPRQVPVGARDVLMSLETTTRSVQRC